MTSLLEIQNMSLRLSGRRILENISLSVAPGEFLGLVGPNGGGKTSLLRLLLGILHPSEGRIRWTPDSAGERPCVGYVPQRGYVDRSYPLSAREIVKQGAHGSRPFFGAARRKSALRAEALMERFGLTEHSKTSFARLSGGQQRRCLLARALMNSPAVLLLDEPTSGVDAKGQQQFCSILNELSLEGVTILLVSHDIPLIVQYARRVACLAVTLRWSGDADALDQQTVADAYRRELERYQIFERNHCE
jgi:zinc transport system ATP-binding protein